MYNIYYTYTILCYTYVGFSRRYNIVIKRRTPCIKFRVQPKRVFLVRPLNDFAISETKYRGASPTQQ